MTPFFSIVVPTTRPHYLPTSLASVFAQTFGDFEVVVSDNTADGLTGRYAIPSDARLRVLRPPGPMNVSSHWDFAFAAARGRWRLMLCDDDALVPQALACLKRLIDAHPGIEAIRWSHAAFAPDAPQGRRLRLPEFSGRAETIAAEPVLRAVFASGTVPGPMKPRTPNIPLAAIADTLDSRLRAAAGGAFFRPFDPMTSMALLTLTRIERFVAVDLPLTLLGETLDSASGSISRAGDPTSVFESTNGDSRLVHTPIKSRRLLPALKSETMLDLRATYPRLFGAYSFDWAGYFHFCAAAIAEFEARATDMSPERRMYAAALAAADPEVRAALTAGYVPPRDTPPPASPKRLARIAASLRDRLGKILTPHPAPVAADLQSIDRAAAFVGRRYAALLG
ncbi:MAG: glycosyltransferase family 2 protein [Tagaea sp.]|nr:glycosyltransferase family 2 protein [Tagaea sp.]